MRQHQIQYRATWDDVVELLLDDKSPGEVVLGYSVTDEFPSRSTVADDMLPPSIDEEDEDYEERYEEWRESLYDDKKMSDDEWFDLTIEWLKKPSTFSGNSIEPDRLRTMWYGDVNVDGFQLREYARDEDYFTKVGWDLYGEN